jgi:hypothetical protein
MTVIHVIRLWPENRIIVCIEAVHTHHYFAVSNWQLGDEGSIRGADKIFSIQKESPDFAIHHTYVPCKNIFSRKAIPNPRFNRPPLTQNLNKLTFISMPVILISSY